MSRGPRILVDGRWRGLHGIGRFAQEVVSRFPSSHAELGGLPLLHPLEPAWLSVALAKRRPDVYFTPGFNPPLRSPVPVVFTIHDLIHLRVPGEIRAATVAYYRFVVRPAARRAYRVLTVSQFCKEEIVEWAGLPSDRVTVVRNGVGRQFGVEGPHHEAGYPYVLYVGNQKPHKNLERLLVAFARSTLPGDVRLLLSGAPGPRILERVTRLGLEKHVVFAGTIPDDRLAALYRAALAVVLPSVYEGFGLPALEAMACGTPVVASRVTAIPEVVGEAAVLVDPYDVDSIAWGLRRAVQDEELRRCLRRKGVERAKAFDWNDTSAQVWHVLEDAVGTQDNARAGR